MTSRTALVTGTAQGIGRAIARELAASGLRVVGVDINPHSDAALAGVIVADLSRIDECLRVVSEAGEVDVLVNNAAVLVQEPLETFDMGDYEHVMAVNLRAPFLLGRELGPLMAARGWGRIVNISSIGARTGGLADSAVYSAAKAGLVAFTKNFARTSGPGVSRQMPSRRGRSSPRWQPVSSNVTLPSKPGSPPTSPCAASPGRGRWRQWWRSSPLTKPPTSMAPLSTSTAAGS